MAQQRGLTTTKKQMPVPTDVSNIDESKYPEIRKIREDMELLELCINLMVPGIDYGTEKGIDKPFLHKPGTERLAKIFQIYPEFEDIDESLPLEDFYRHKFICRAYRVDSQTGEKLYAGMGAGSCSSRESKYRYRWFYEKALPTEMKRGMTVIITGKDNKEREVIDMQKWVDAHGVGSARMTDYGVQVRLENPDIADIDNTVLSQAKKRSFADCIKTVTGADRKFITPADVIQDPTLAQEVEDSINDGEAPVIPVDADIENEPKAQPAQKSKPTTSEQTEKGKFYNQVKKLLDELGWEWKGPEFKKVMEPYYNCKYLSDLSSTNRKDLLRVLTDELERQKTAAAAPAQAPAPPEKPAPMEQRPLI